MTPEELEQLKVRTFLIKKSYLEISSTPAFEELLAWVRDQKTSSLRIAESEMDNSTRKLLYLQEYSSYAKVESHLEDMLS